MAYKPQSQPGMLLDPANPINRGLVGWWPLNEGGGIRANDLSPFGNTGTLTNGPTWAGGRFGKALVLDGVNDYVNMGDKSSLEINGNSFTWGGWFYVKAYPPVSNRMFLITKGKGTGYEYEMSVSGYASNKLTANIYNTGSSNYIINNSNSVPPLNTWFHFMAVWDKDAVSLKAYYNGALDTTTTATSGAIHDVRTAPFQIGRREDGAEKTLQGNASEVRIYNRALSATEIVQLYTQPSVGLYSPNIGKYFIQAVAASSARVWAAIFG